MRPFMNDPFGLREPMWTVGNTPVEPDQPVRPGRRGDAIPDSLGTLREIVKERDAIKAEAGRLKGENEGLRERYAELTNAYNKLSFERGKLEIEIKRLQREAMEGMAAPLTATLQSTQDSGIAGIYAVLGNLPELIAALGKEIRGTEQQEESFTRVNVKGDATVDGVPFRQCHCCNHYYTAKIGCVVVSESLVLKAVPDGPNVPARVFTFTLPSGQTITVTE